jgi:hypothetical protein
MELARTDPEWAVGFQDECWWSRVALPTLNAWRSRGGQAPSTPPADSRQRRS